MNSAQCYGWGSLTRLCGTLQSNSCRSELSSRKCAVARNCFVFAPLLWNSWRPQHGTALSGTLEDSCLQMLVLGSLTRKLRIRHIRSQHARSKALFQSLKVAAPSVQCPPGSLRCHNPEGKQICFLNPFLSACTCTCFFLCSLTLSSSNILEDLLDVTVCRCAIIGGGTNPPVDPDETKH